MSLVVVVLVVVVKHHGKRSELGIRKNSSAA